MSGLDTHTHTHRPTTVTLAAHVRRGLNIQMNGDIGMANYEKQVEQEAAYPIPISLYYARDCTRAVKLYAHV